MRMSRWHRGAKQSSACCRIVNRISFRLVTVTLDPGVRAIGTHVRRAPDPQSAQLVWQSFSPIELRFDGLYPCESAGAVTYSKPPGGLAPDPHLLATEPPEFSLEDWLPFSSTL
jgi:hypothetical protein